MYPLIESVAMSGYTSYHNYIYRLRIRERPTNIDEEYTFKGANGMP